MNWAKATDLAESNFGFELWLGTVESMSSERDAAQRNADLEWLYGGTPDPKQRQRDLHDAEAAELARRQAKREAAAAQAAAGKAAAPAPPSPRPTSAGNPVAGAQAPSPRPRSQQASAASPAVDLSAGAAASARPRSGSTPPPTPRTPASGATPPPRSPASGATPPPRTPASDATPPPRTPPPGGKVAAGASGKGRKPRPRWLKITGGIVALLAVWAVWLGLVPMYSWTSMKQIDATPAGDRPAQQPGTAILLIGSDSRDDLTAAEKAKLGTGTDTGTRTDTMMILYVPPSGKSVLLSLPRDSYVPIPGHGHNKLNAAFSLGGPQLLMQTIEQDTGMRMDGYLEIGMDGFAKVIDSIGGIRMCLPTAMKDKDSHTNLPAGCQNLNGTQALGYVRMRTADPLGDLGRVKRQREMIAAVAKKATSLTTLANPVRYWKLNMAVRDALQRQGLGVFSLPGVGSGLMDVANGKGLQLTVPVSNADATTAAGSSVLWDREKALELFHKLEAGDTSGLEQFQK